MKKKLKRLLCVLVCFAVVPISVWAVAGGTGEGGGAGGNTGSSNTSTSFFWQQDTDAEVRVAAYRFDLVYKPKNGNRYIIKTVVAQDTSGGGGSYCSNQSMAIQLVRQYASTVNSLGEAKNGATYVNSGPLADLARRLTNGEAIDDIFNQNMIEDEKVIKNYISSAQGFNVDEDELRLEQDDNPGSINSFGYRILIQKIQLYARGNTWSCSTNYYRFAATRKDVASNSAVKQRLAGNMNVFIAPYQLAKIGSDLWTTRDDIGIRNGYPYRILPNETGAQVRNRAQYFADWNNGLGYNILWFSTAPFKNYDYTIDAACVNCNSNKADNKAYIIQDTNNWDAIFASSDSDNKNVKEYYYKENGVYCREEYTVYFPNATNTIYVDPGRYFTLNPSAEALKEVISSAAIPNMKPVKVVKKRQCRVNPDKNSSNATTVLDSFRRKSEYDFKGKTGTVSFKYNETYSDSRYNMDDPEEMDISDEETKYSYSINNSTLNMEVTQYYTLPDNYYQYIRKQDGLSMKVKPSANLSHYINVGIPNLPVSFNNTGDNGVAADIQFSYELPKDDKYSKLDEAYIENNSYLKTDNDGNIYKRYSTGNLREGENIGDSACAKMFGVGTSAFRTCVSNRQNNSIGDTDKNANCIANSKITNSTKSGYSCIVLTSTTPPNGDGDCRTEADANRLGRDWNPYNQSCCPVGTTYNPTLGKCEPNNETCRIENGKYYDFDGKEISKEEYDRICPNSGGGDTCRIENGKYYDFDGNEITKDEYDRICPSNIPPYCPSTCEYGCCPSGECAPMPDGTCPGAGGIDVIYRTIDLVNPFPGQNAEQRNTGANWCSYNIRTQKIDCKYNNQTVKNYITREKGGTENGGKVYREDHVLYEITLDSSTIGKIRDYNDDNKYDDWDLSCYNESDGKVTTDSRVTYGKACKSEFLRDYLAGKVSGKCSKSTNSNFYTCDEDV